MKALDNGKYGAKVQSWSKANPREVLFHIINKMSGSERQDIFDAFWRQIKSDDDMLMTVAAYWFANNYYSLLDQSDVKKKRKVLSLREIKKRIKKRTSTIIFLDMIMPSGRKLRNSTGRECSRAGGLFLAIARAIKPTDVVGHKLSEIDVKRIFESIK